MPPAPLGLYVVNLDRATERWRAVSAAFAPLPWLLTRIPALDARDDVAAVLRARGTRIVVPPAGLGWNPYRFRLHSLAQEACFASHLVALDAFLASGDALALVLEDDAEPLAGLPEALSALAAGALDFELVKVEHLRRPGRRLAVPVARAGPARLVASLRPSSGSAAYLVTRAGAERLLRSGRDPRRAFIPYDDFLANPALTGCRTLHLAPGLVRQADGPSTLAPGGNPYRHVKQRGLGPAVRQNLLRIGLRLRLWADALRPHPGGPRLPVPRRVPW